MSRLAIASWTLLSFGVTAAVVGVSLVPALGRNAESAVRRPVLIESPACGHRSSETVRNGHGRPRATNGGATTLALIVTVPRTAIVQFDAAGRVVAAMTNTGCAPRPIDDVYVSTADGAVTRNSSVDVGRIAWVGNFTSPGVFQPQRR